MTVIDEVIREFGRSIGMEVLALREDGALVLDMQRLGTLAIELIGERREDLSLSLSRRITPPDEAACSRLLEMCHYRSAFTWPVRAGLTSSGDLLFAIRIETADLTLPNLHQSLDWLDGLHQQSDAFVRPA